MIRSIFVCLTTAILLGATLVGAKMAGTLTVTAGATQCAHATTIEIWRRSPEPIPHRPDQPSEMLGYSIPLLGRGAVQVWFTRIDREPVGADCRWSFVDLPDGDYVARLVGPTGSNGSQAAELSAGLSRTIEIPAPTVTLSGLVTLDGRAHAAEVRIRDRLRTGPTVTVTSDAGGRYTATLDRPATYAITALTAPRGATGRIVDLHEGQNQFDITVVMPTDTAGDFGLNSLTVPDRDLPEGCQLRRYAPYVPTNQPSLDNKLTTAAANSELFRSNPWIGFNRRALISLLGTGPVLDASIPKIEQMRTLQSTSLSYLREGYRALYDSAEGNPVEVRAVRFDDAKHLPATGSSTGRNGAVVNQFAIGRIFVQIAARKQTECSRAIGAYIRTLK